MSLFLEYLQTEKKLSFNSDQSLQDRRYGFDPAIRQLKQVKELEKYTQKLISSSRINRDALFWDKMEVRNVESWINQKNTFRIICGMKLSDGYQKTSHNQFQNPVNYMMRRLG